MFDNKWQRKEMPLVSLIGMGGGIASPAFLASIVLNILKPTVFSPADDTGVPDFDYNAESSAITNINQISGGWSSVSFDSNAESGNNQWTATAYGNGKYVALGKVGNAYLAANSSNGTDWTSYNTIPYTGYSELAYGNGAFVAVGQNKISYSTDEGESWSTASVASNWYKGVVYGDGKFVAVSEDGHNARVVTSSDGINWVGIPDTDSSAWQAVTYGGGKFVAVSQMGGVMYSSDGTNWSTTSATESAVWNSVAYGNGKFVAVAGLSTMYSTDGINWFSGNNTTGYWQDITFGDGRFVAVSNYQDSNYPAAAGYSTDGDTWTPSNQAIPNTWNGVDYVNGRFIAVASGVVDGSRMMWSPTGMDEATELTLTDTTVSKVSDGTLIEGTTIDQVLTVGETVQADTAIFSTVSFPVFSTTLYSYTSNPQTITNGIDLAGEGGLIWTKWRSGGAYSVESHCLIDTERSSGSASDQYGTFTPYLKCDTDGNQLNANYLNFNSDGYEIITPSSLINHDSGGQYVSWTFGKKPGFFDIVTYDGDPNTAYVPQTISHNLGSAPGAMIIKAYSHSAVDWFVYHKELGATQHLMLNHSDKAYTSTNIFNDTEPTSSEFTVGAYSAGTNNNGRSYVNYLFADTPGLIKCGSYVGTGADNNNIDCGFEPGWLMIKNADENGSNNYNKSDWYISDNQRGFSSSWGLTDGKLLRANTNASEVSDADIVVSATGFKPATTGAEYNKAGIKYVYIAISTNPNIDVTTSTTASGTVSASSGNTITLSDVSGTWSTGMELQGTDSDTKDYPDPIRIEDVSLTSSAPTADNDVSTWGGAVWEIATDINFTQNVQTATTALSTTGTQTGPSFTLQRETGYYTRTKYTALGQQSEWSDVTYFVTKGLPLYADDVFSTYLYEGNNSTQTINNGIDLAGEGGLVWIKNRTMYGSNHTLYDTERSGTLFSDATNAASDYASEISSFNNNGFSLVNGSTSTYNNKSGQNYASWTFRKAAGFFDILTFTGNGGTQTIPHSLGTSPGMIFVKSLDAAYNWTVWHRSLSTGQFLRLNTKAGANSSYQNSHVSSVSSTDFTLGGDGEVNNNNQDYVAYIFAHDDQSFGTNNDEAIIHCGSFTGSASDLSIDIGFEPQWIIFNNIDAPTRDWMLFDNMRDGFVSPNLNNDEGGNLSSNLQFEPTGFRLLNQHDHNIDGETTVFMAIRSPHKP